MSQELSQRLLRREEKIQEKIKKILLFYLEKKIDNLVSFTNFTKSNFNLLNKNREIGYVLLKNREGCIIKYSKQINLDDLLFTEITDANLILKIIKINQKKNV